MRLLVSRFLIAGLLLASVADCVGPLDKASRPARAALDPFAKAGYNCAGPTSDQSAFGQWQCSRTSADGVAYFVVLDADDTIVKQVLATVDQSNSRTPDRSVAADFFHEITNIGVGGSTQDLRQWVDAHLSTGGQEQVGPVFATLDSLRPVTHLVLFASG